MTTIFPMPEDRGSYDEGTARLCRLHHWLGYLRALCPDFDEAQLAEMADHEGMLRLTWRKPPTIWVQACVAKAWSMQNEPPENVEHRMRGQSGYAERIVILEDYR